MARIKGAVSSVGIKLEDLLAIIGPDYKGKISVGAKWLNSLMSPEEFEVVKIGERPNSISEIDTSQAPGAVDVVRPKFKCL
jgi:hypothetical protein